MSDTIAKTEKLKESISGTRNRYLFIKLIFQYFKAKNSLEIKNYQILTVLIDIDRLIDIQINR